MKLLTKKLYYLKLIKLFNSNFNRVEMTAVVIKYLLITNNLRLFICDEKKKVQKYSFSTNKISFKRKSIFKPVLSKLKKIRIKHTSITKIFFSCIKVIF